jgi:hypothetical protein
MESASYGTSEWSAAWPGRGAGVECELERTGRPRRSEKCRDAGGRKLVSEVAEASRSLSQAVVRTCRWKRWLTHISLGDGPT